MEAVTAPASGTGSKTMADLAAIAAEKFADKTALTHKVGDEWVHISYADFGTAVSEVGRGLIDLGMAPGDKVAIVAHTRPEWTYAHFGILAAGAVSVSDLPDQLRGGVPLRAGALGVQGGVPRGCGAAGEDPRGARPPAQPRASDPARSRRGRR